MMPKGHVVTPLIDRVMSRVDMIPESGCWIFTGSANEKGYGVVGKGDRGAGNEKAHRVTYRHYVGEIPPGMFVCHRCDVPSCVNPAHLFLGTNTDNMRDCFSKGRGSNPPRNEHVVGEAHPNSKLTADQVQSMRAMRASGATYQAIADRFGINNAYAWAVINGRKWKHVA